MHKNFPKIILFSLAVISAGFFICPAHAQMNGSSLSADEMLEYTLDNLQNRMHELADSNRMQVNKNEALRQRIFVMRQEIRNLENRKMDFIELSNDIQETTGLHAKEVETVETRLRNMYQHKVDMLKEQDRMNAQIKASVEKNVQLEAKLKDFEERINNYKQDSLTRANAAKESAVKEKIDLKSLIDEKRANVGDLEKQVRNLEKSVEDMAANRQILQSQQASLQRDFDSADRLLSAELEKAGQLQGNNEKFADDRKDSLRTAQYEIKHLRDYAQTLKESVSNLREVQQRVAKESALQQKKMIEWKSALNEEQQLLKGQEASAAISQDIQSDSLNGTAKNTSPEDLSQRVAAVKDAQAQLKDIVSSKQDQQKVLTQRQSQISTDIEDLQKLLQKLTSTGVASEKDKANMTKEINGLIRQQETKNTELAKKVDSLMSGANQPQSRLEDLTQEHKVLAANVESEENNLQKLIAQEITLREESNLSSQGQSKNLDEVRDAIEALKLRKMNLSNSLSLVKAKYGAEKSSVESFANEQGQLQDYLNILQQENSSLEEKALGLTVAADRLKTQRQGLLSTSSTQ